MAGSATSRRAQTFVDALRVVRLPYHLSAVTQAVARARWRMPMSCSPGWPICVPSATTASWLRDLGLDAADSDANFVLFGTFADRHAVWQGLLDHGVLIRETGPDGWLRVSVGTPEEMAAFRDARLTSTLDLISSSTPARRRR